MDKYKKCGVNTASQLKITTQTTFSKNLLKNIFYFEIILYIHIIIDQINNYLI